MQSDPGLYKLTIRTASKEICPMTERKERKDFPVYDASGQLRHRIDQAAQQADLNRSQWVRHAIREKLAREGIN
jgi:hypothetical protein